MITDSFFEQGSTHEVCEDYALHGPAFVIIADGCSNGKGPRVDTDWGSRLICKAAQQCLYMFTTSLELFNPPTYLGQEQAFFQEVAKIAKEQVEIIGNLSEECLSATLGLLYQDPLVKRLLLMGDGTCGARRLDGKWEIRTYEPYLESGKPSGCFYLKYLMFNQVDSYFEQFKGTYKSTTYIGDLFGPDEMEIKEEIVTITPEQPYFFFSFPNDEYDLVFVGSDGLSSFTHPVRTATSKYVERISVRDALKVILHEIELTDGCLRLQRDWAWKRNLPETLLGRNWRNTDDVSLGLIYGQ
jgi:hypothetical protein